MKIKISNKKQLLVEILAFAKQMADDSKWNYNQRCYYRDSPRNCGCVFGYMAICTAPKNIFHGLIHFDKLFENTFEIPQKEKEGVKYVVGLLFSQLSPDHICHHFGREAKKLFNEEEADKMETEFRLAIRKAERNSFPD